MIPAPARESKLLLGLPQDPVLEPLPMAGSDRYYWRASVPGRRPFVVCRHEGLRPENSHFPALARFLAAHGVRCPAIIADAPAEHLLMLEDLGDRSLESIASHGTPDDLLPAYRAAIAEIARLHSIPPAAADAVSAHLQPPFEASLYLWEQGYFLKHFAAGHLGLPAATVARLEADPGLHAMAESLATRPRTLIHRDFQSQNILLQPDGRAALIDFQGLRFGLPEYDLASLLLDPYVDLPAATRDALFNHYHALRGTDAAASRPLFQACAIQRLMQALGAYANLSANSGKSWYLRFIPPAVDRLRALAHGHPAATALADILAP